MTPRSWLIPRYRGGLGALHGAVTESAWKTKPSRYSVATDDNMIPPDAQRAMSKHDVHPFEGGRDMRKDRIAIVQEIPGYLVLWKSVAQLLCRPCRCRMRGDRRVNDPSAVVSEDDKHEEQSECHRRYDEKVRGHDLARVIGENGAPRL